MADEKALTEAGAPEGQADNGNDKKKGSRAKKALSIVGDVLLGLLLVFSVFTLFFSVSSRDGSETGFFGYQMRLVVSESMEKCDETDVSDYEIKDIPINSLVFIRGVPEDETEKEAFYSELEVGDVLTFRYAYSNEQVTITHRLVKIEKEEEGYHLYLQGDNHASDQGVLTQEIHTADESSYDYVIGKVTYVSHFLGLAVTAIRSPWGIFLLIILPCLIIIAYEIVRLVRLRPKREKPQPEASAISEKDAEIEDLKRQLAEARSAPPEEKKGDGTDKPQSSQ